MARGGKCSTKVLVLFQFVLSLVDFVLSRLALAALLGWGVRQLTCCGLLFSSASAAPPDLGLDANLDSWTAAMAAALASAAVCELIRFNSLFFFLRRLFALHCASGLVQPARLSAWIAVPLFINVARASSMIGSLGRPAPLSGTAADATVLTTMKASMRVIASSPMVGTVVGSARRWWV